MRDYLFILTLAFTLSFRTAPQAVGQPQNGAAAESSLPHQTTQEKAAIRPATTQSTVSIEQEILALEERMEALQRSDSAERTALWAGDLVYIGNDGRVHDKPSLSRAISAGEAKAESLEVTERKVRVYGDVAVVTALEHKRASFHGRDARDFLQRYTRVWVRRGGTWQMVSYQATAVTSTPAQNASDVTPNGHASVSDCNQPASTALTTVPLPGHPFSIVSTSDGCWLFVSVTSDDPKANGVAVLRRAAGTISLEHVYPIEARKGRIALRPGPSGMVMTHDGKLLIAVNDDDLTFLDVPSMISGKPAPVVGRLNSGPPKHATVTSNSVTETSAGSFYVNLTKDDALIFVSEEYAETISVIDLAKARRSKYDPSAIVGRIPVGVAPIALTFSPDERWLYTTSEGAPPSWNWPRFPRTSGGFTRPARVLRPHGTGR